MPRLSTCANWTYELTLSLLVFSFACPAARADGRLPTRSTTVTNCQLRAVDEVKLASERSGILDKVAQAGTYVKAGTTVALLRDSLARASLAIAAREAANDIEVRFARKAAQVAQLNYEKTVEANRILTGTVTDFELRELRLAAEKSLLQLEQAEHQFQVAGLRHQEQREVLNALSIVAPYDAFVRFAHKQPGEFVREGEVILEIVNTSRMQVEGYVDVNRLSDISYGDPVEVTLAGADSPAAHPPVAGRIVFVDVKLEPVSQRVRIWAEAQNHNGLLREGQTVNMTIHPRPRSTR